MDKEIAEVLNWLAQTIEIYDIRLGNYEAMFDETAQYQEWRCHGCTGTGYAKWPEWKVVFEHKPDCMYGRLLQLIHEARTGRRPESPIISVLG